MLGWLRALLLSLTLGLVGCASVPLGSVVPLLRLDLATTRIEALRVAVRLPEAVRPRAGGVVLDVVLTRQGLPELKQGYLLVETEGAADLAGLVGQQRPGFRLTAYRLGAEDLERFRAVQDALAEARVRGQSGSLGFGIATREFCRTGSGTPGRIPASTYLMTAESNGWLTVSEDFDLMGEPTVAAALADLAPC